MIRTIVLLVFGLLLVGMSVRSLRQLRMQERFMLLFFVTGLPFLTLAIWPDLIVWLSEQMDMEKPTLMVFCLGAFTILLLLKLFSIISVQQRQITTLAQTVGMLQQKLLENKPKDNADES
jgi:hypothetical protein